MSPVWEKETQRRINLAALGYVDLTEEEYYELQETTFRDSERESSESPVEDNAD